MKIYLCNTILSINPNAQVSVLGEDINTLVWHDGNPTNITNEQILAKQIELQTQEDNRIANSIAKKASAKAKLAALGLDEEEIKAITGL
jgi:hypothetical protein